MRLSSVLALYLAAHASAGTVTYNWDVTWVTAAPDGFARTVIGINNQWPCPPMEAVAGDTVVVNLNNKLGNQTIGLHFHGFNQINTDFMDGTSGVTQCPVPPGSSVTYKFVADAPGTFWYHSHNMGQYPDGLRGSFIVRDLHDPYAGMYDEEVVITLSDWYHSSSLNLVQNMITPANVQFLPPFPDGILVNEGRGANITVVKGKRYRFRFISFAAFASTMLHFDSHTMTVIMTDGSYTQPEKAYQLRITPAQRYDVLICAVDRDHRNYPFSMSLDINRDWKNDPASAVVWPHNATGYLVMDPSGAFPLDVVGSWSPVDDSTFKPVDLAPMLAPVTRTVQLDFNFCRDENNLPRACFNNQTYIAQKVPTLYSVATLGEDNMNPALYGNINPFVFEYGDVVDVVVNNLDAAIHPFHMHGHQFQVLDRPGSNAGAWGGHDRTFAAVPMRRDTVAVAAKSYAVLRFQVQNPGVFLFHCHIEWHVEMGLTATFIEAPDRLRGISFPDDHIANCKAMGIPTSGNAAGNANPTDTSGFNTVPPATYTGAQYTVPQSRFRPRGLKARL